MTELSREAILAIQPGRELNVIVAEKVMGWTDTGEEIGLAYGLVKTQHKNSRGNFEKIPDYSTDISAAWEIVEMLKATHHFMLSWDAQIGNQMALFQTLKEDCPYEVFDYVGDSMSENICKAALLTTLEEEI